jgi:antitoxin MazE
MTSQIGQWGNSLALRIPKHILEALHLQINDAIDCTVEDGKLVITPIRALPELSLDDLLAEVVAPIEAAIDWGGPVGNEIW